MAEIWLDGGSHRAAIYKRTALTPGHALSGPAIVTQDDCTTIVPPRHHARVDGWGNLLIEA